MIRNLLPPLTVAALLLGAAPLLAETPMAGLPLPMENEVRIEDAERKADSNRKLIELLNLQIQNLESRIFALEGKPNDS